MPSETTTAQPNSPSEKTQTSEVTKGSTSIETPVTFTKEQVEKSVRDALAEAGRKHKADVEAAVTKAQESQKATIEEHLSRITELEADLDELAKEDGDKTEILKLKRELRSEKDSLSKDRKTYQTEKEAHDKEWQEHETEIQEARSERFALVAWDIADEFEGGDAVKLKTICERSKILTEEFAREMAATLWTKKSEVKKPLVVGTPDPGGTAGGANTWESIRDAYSATPNDPAIRAQYLEARRKRGI
jgi:hypothetical protein